MSFYAQRFTATDPTSCASQGALYRVTHRVKLGQTGPVRLPSSPPAAPGVAPGSADDTTLPGAGSYATVAEVRLTLNMSDPVAWPWMDGLSTQTQGSSSSTASTSAVDVLGHDVGLLLALSPTSPASSAGADQGNSGAARGGEDGCSEGMTSKLQAALAEGLSSVGVLVRGLSCQQVNAKSLGELASSSDPLVSPCMARPAVTALYAVTLRVEGGRVTDAWPALAAAFPSSTSASQLADSSAAVALRALGAVCASDMEAWEVRTDVAVSLRVPLETADTATAQATRMLQLQAAASVMPLLLLPGPPYTLKVTSFGTGNGEVDSSPVPMGVAAVAGGWRVLPPLSTSMPPNALTQGHSNKSSCTGRVSTTLLIIIVVATVVATALCTCFLVLAMGWVRRSRRGSSGLGASHGGAGGAKVRALTPHEALREVFLLAPTRAVTPQNVDQLRVLTPHLGDLRMVGTGHDVGLDLDHRKVEARNSPGTSHMMMHAASSPTSVEGDVAGSGRGSEGNKRGLLASVWQGLVQGARGQAARGDDIDHDHDYGHVTWTNMLYDMEVMNTGSIAPPTRANSTLSVGSTMSAVSIVMSSSSKTTRSSRSKLAKHLFKSKSMNAIVDDSSPSSSGRLKVGQTPGASSPSHSRSCSPSPPPSSTLLQHLLKSTQCGEGGMHEFDAAAVQSLAQSVAPGRDEVGSAPPAGKVVRRGASRDSTSAQALQTVHEVTPLEEAASGEVVLAGAAGGGGDGNDGAVAATLQQLQAQMDAVTKQAAAAAAEVVAGDGAGDGSWGLEQLARVTALAEAQQAVLMEQKHMLEHYAQLLHHHQHSQQHPGGAGVTATGGVGGVQSVTGSIAWAARAVAMAASRAANFGGDVPPSPRHFPTPASSSPRPRHGAGLGADVMRDGSGSTANAAAALLGGKADGHDASAAREETHVGIHPQSPQQVTQMCVGAPQATVAGGGGGGGEAPPVLEGGEGVTQEVGMVGTVRRALGYNGEGRA